MTQVTYVALYTPRARPLLFLTHVKSQLRTFRKIEVCDTFHGGKLKEMDQEGRTESQVICCAT
jgi:hypothetical protein